MYGPTKHMPTWREFATHSPEFVQWAMERYGLQPEDSVDERELRRYLDAWVAEHAV